MTRPPRRVPTKKFDRLLNSGAEQEELMCDYAVAPMDDAARQMDDKWGVDRLPELVSFEMAAKYGRAIAAVNEAIKARDAAACARMAANCVKGLAAMDAEAMASGAVPARSDIWEVEHNGKRIGIIKDISAWRRAKAERPDLAIYSLKEVAVALSVMSNELINSVKDNFPGSEVVEIKKGTAVPKIVDDNLDEVFGEMKNKGGLF